MRRFALLLLALLAPLCASCTEATLCGVDPCASDDPQTTRCAEYERTVCEPETCGPFHRRRQACRCMMRAMMEEARR